MLKQTLQQKLLQKLSPQQIQLMKLLQLPAVALEQRIKEEMESNPALDEGTLETEEDYDAEIEDRESEQDYDDIDFDEYLDDDTPSYKLYTMNKGKDTDEKSIPFSQGRSFQEMLESQLQMQVLSEKEEVIAQTIIGNLDEAGYVRRDLESIVDDLAFSMNVETNQEEVLAVLHIIQSFDPAGIGARSLQECLLLQLDRYTHRTFEIVLAKEILKDYFDEFTKKHYDKIIQKLGVEEDDLKAALEEILKLNPKPGNTLNENVRVIEQIIPDFVITTHTGNLELSLNSRNAPELHLNKQYTEMLEGFSERKGSSSATKEDKAAMVFVKQKIDSAKWFIDAIKQRRQTLLLTMDAIMHMQKEYFLSGDETKLKPMILKDIADKVGLDISTISRVVNSKYVQTPYGTFLLKTFFSESLETEAGEEVSTREVKKILTELIESEDKRKPITDEKLAEELKKKGYKIARRTVAKYREQLKIPVARLRKVL